MWNPSCSCGIHVVLWPYKCSRRSYRPAFWPQHIEHVQSFTYHHLVQRWHQYMCRWPHLGLQVSGLGLQLSRPWQRKFSLHRASEWPWSTSRSCSDTGFWKELIGWSISFILVVVALHGCDCVGKFCNFDILRSWSSALLLTRKLRFEVRFDTLKQAERASEGIKHTAFWHHV
jgi:hypothetical protein